MGNLFFIFYFKINNLLSLGISFCIARHTTHTQTHTHTNTHTHTTHTHTQTNTHTHTHTHTPWKASHGAEGGVQAEFMV